MKFESTRQKLIAAFFIASFIVIGCPCLILWAFSPATLHDGYIASWDDLPLPSHVFEGVSSNNVYLYANQGSAQ